VSDTVPSIVDGVSFEGAHVLVTGVAGAIGAQIAADFSTAGASVTGVDVNDPGDAPWRDGGRFVEADVSRSAAVEAAVTAATERAGDLAVVVNNAGINHLGSIEDVDVADWEQVLAVNLEGCFLVSRYALPSLRRTGGNIVNVASTAGMHAAPDYAAYAPSKAGVLNLTRQVALDYASEGVRVNAVSPGVVEAGMAMQELADADVAMRKEAITPLDRLGRPRDVANAVLFVASDAASFVTGANVVTDGGVSA
jgi:NAD(P)-dependent dehydrogenase (short-subunit alcohol dehydrogenase family)